MKGVLQCGHPVFRRSFGLSSQTGILTSYPFWKQFLLGQKAPLVETEWVVAVLEEEKVNEGLRDSRDNCVSERVDSASVPPSSREATQF